MECINSQENSIATIPRDDASVQDVEDPRSLKLIFGQRHNEIDCAWCTAKQIEKWSEMSKKTLWRWLEKLEKARRISLVSDMTLANVPTATGAKSTTFYNLNVLNQLATMCRVCRDRDMAVINGKEYSADLAGYSESRVFFRHTGETGNPLSLLSLRSSAVSAGFSVVSAGF